MDEHDPSTIDVGRQRPEERAQIVRRYAELDAPTAAETDDVMRALGVTKHNLNTLVRTWRSHGRTSMRLRAAKNDAAVRIAAIEAAEGPLDLAEFDPVRRPEIERRIRIIGRYLRTDTIARSVSDTFAREYGMGYNAFRRAVTAWLLNPGPSSVPGVARWTSGRSRSRQLLDTRVEAIMSDAFDAVGIDVGVGTMHRRIVQLCNAANLPPPSKRHVGKRLKAALTQRVKTGRDLALYLDRVAIETADVGCSPRPPMMVTLLFGATTGRIFAYGADPGGPSSGSDAAVLLHYVRACRSPDETPVLLQAAMPADEPGWPELVQILGECGVRLMPTSATTLLSSKLTYSTFGNSIAGLTIKKMDVHVHRRLDASVPPSPEALATLSRAIVGHNAVRPGEPPRMVPGRHLADAIERLAALAAGTQH